MRDSSFDFVFIQYPEQACYRCRPAFYAGPAFMTVRHFTSFSLKICSENAGKMTDIFTPLPAVAVQFPSTLNNPEKCCSGQILPKYRYILLQPNLGKIWPKQHFSGLFCNRNDFSDFTPTT